MRALDRKLSVPDSVVSKRIVAQLAAETLLYKAEFLENCCVWGLGNLVRCALEAQMSPDTKAEEVNGSTPVLVAAAFFGSSRALEVLLAGGANTDLADQNGATALAAATTSGHLSTVQLLLDAGANVNAQNWLGNTPLMIAVMHTQVECVRALLPVSDLNMTNFAGHAAFMLPPSLPARRALSCCCPR